MNLIAFNRLLVLNLINKVNNRVEKTHLEFKIRYEFKVIEIDFLNSPVKVSENVAKRGAPLRILSHCSKMRVNEKKSQYFEGQLCLLHHYF